MGRGLRRVLERFSWSSGDIMRGVLVAITKNGHLAEIGKDSGAGLPSVLSFVDKSVRPGADITEHKSGRSM